MSRERATHAPWILAGALSATTVGAVACSGVLGLGDLVYDREPGAGGGVGGQGGAGASGGTGAVGGAGAEGGVGGVGGTGGTGGTGAVGAGGIGGGGGQQPSAPPLELAGSMGSGLLTAFVEGQFRLEFHQSLQWQIGAWFDLVTDPSTDLAVGNNHSNVLVEPVETFQAGIWYGVSGGSSATISVVDQTPARIRFDTSMSWAPAGSNLVLRTIYTVWASGQVGIDSRLTNTGASDQDFTTIEYNHHTVSNAVPWSGIGLASPRSYAYQRVAGPQPAPTLLVINHGADTSIGHDNAQNVYWDAGGVSLVQGASFVRPGAFRVYPGGLDLPGLDGRAADALNPAIVAVEGATLVGSGYDPAQAAYVVDATGATVRLRVTSSLERYSPAFVIGSFSHAAWTVSLDGVELASSSRRSGAYAHAQYDAGAEQLAFVYLESIPTDAPDAERTFVIEGQ